MTSAWFHDALVVIRYLPDRIGSSLAIEDVSATDCEVPLTSDQEIVTVNKIALLLPTTSATAHVRVNVVLLPITVSPSAPVV